MFGHDGDDYDEELVCNEKFLKAANEMFADNFPRELVMRKLRNMNCNVVEAERICNIAEEADRKRRIRYSQFVKKQRDVSERNHKDMEYTENERKIGISKIRDDEDLVRTR